MVPNPARHEMATLEEMADPGALRALREAQADARAGRMYSYEDVFGRPPLRHRRKKRYVRYRRGA